MYYQVVLERNQASALRFSDSVMLKHVLLVGADDNKDKLRALIKLMQQQVKSKRSLWLFDSSEEGLLFQKAAALLPRVDKFDFAGGQADEFNPSATLNQSLLVRFSREDEGTKGWGQALYERVIMSQTPEAPVLLFLDDGLIKAMPHEFIEGFAKKNVAVILAPSHDGLDEIRTYRYGIFEWMALVPLLHCFKAPDNYTGRALDDLIEGRCSVGAPNMI
jgi:hypothetical protein